MWGCVYKDLLAALSELQKYQKLIQNMTTKLEISMTLPPKDLSSSDKHDCTVGIENENSVKSSDIVKASEPLPTDTSDDNNDIIHGGAALTLEDPVAAVAVASPYTPESVKIFIENFVKRAQIQFPDQSMLLLQSKMLMLLQRTREVDDEALPQDVQDACEFLFPRVFDNEWNVERYWSKLSGVVLETDFAAAISSSRREVRGVLSDLLNSLSPRASPSQAESAQNNHEIHLPMSMSSVEIDLLLEFVSEVYPSQSPGVMKAMLHRLAHYGYTLLVIVSAVYVHLFLARNVGNSKSKIGAELEISTYLAWVRGQTRDNSASFTSGARTSLSIIDNVFESNFELFLMKSEKVDASVSIPLCMRSFFEACIKGAQMLPEEINIFSYDL